MEGKIKSGEALDRCVCNHAEANAITKLAKSTESCDGAYMFTTYAPCLECAKLIYQSGIKELHYEYGYKNEDGVNLLKHHWRKFDGQHVYKHGNDLDKWVDDQQLLPFSN